MTEQEWLGATNAYGMLTWLVGRASRRKACLFVAAQLRHAADELSSDAYRQVLDVVERSAEGSARPREIEEVRRLASTESERLWDVAEDAPAGWRASFRAQARAISGGMAVLQDEIARHEWIGLYEGNEWQCRVLRDVFGNPFRARPLVDPDWLAWSGGLVAHLAQEAYEKRSFADLPIIADALEDAGCPNLGILTHLRGPGPHVRGCWVVDLILSRCG